MLKKGKLRLFLVVFVSTASLFVHAQIIVPKAVEFSRNKPERQEWLRDLGCGMLANDNSVPASWANDKRSKYVCIDPRELKNINSSTKKVG